MRKVLSSSVRTLPVLMIALTLENNSCVCGLVTPLKSTKPTATRGTQEVRPRGYYASPLVEVLPLLSSSASSVSAVQPLQRRRMKRLRPQSNDADRQRSASRLSAASPAMLEIEPTQTTVSSSSVHRSEGRSRTKASKSTPVGTRKKIELLKLSPSTSGKRRGTRDSQPFIEIKHESDRISIRSHDSSTMTAIKEKPVIGRSKLKTEVKKKVKTTRPVVRKKLSARLPVVAARGRREKSRNHRSPFYEDDNDDLVVVGEGNGTDKRTLLTLEEETQLAHALRALRDAERIRDEMIFAAGTIDGNKNEDEKELRWARACGYESVKELRRVTERGQRARSELVSKNIGLVTVIARRYQPNSRGGCSLTLQDLVQEGTMGLLEAAERYDPSRGFRFCTYAGWWVRQRILRAQADHSRVIRLPAHVHSMLYTIDKKRKQMTREIGRVPSPPELAHELGMPLEKLKLYTESNRSVLSLETPDRPNGRNGQDTRALGEKIASKDTLSPEDQVSGQNLREDLRKLLEANLTDVERRVLAARFGLEELLHEGVTSTSMPRSIQDLSESLRMSRERVRLVEARAINKLRQPHRSYRLKEYMEDNHHHDDGHGHDTSSDQYHVVSSSSPSSLPALGLAEGDYPIPLEPSPEQIWSF